MLSWSSQLKKNHLFLILQVLETEIEEMFICADGDGDGKISWSEFQTMIKPAKTSEQWAGNPRSEVVNPVVMHPHTLSVRSMMGDKVAPILSETHVSASWTQIGLPDPSVKFA